MQRDRKQVKNKKMYIKDNSNALPSDKYKQFQ